MVDGMKVHDPKILELPLDYDLQGLKQNFQGNWQFTKIKNV